jgi:SAM-dependent methyltransferase
VEPLDDPVRALHNAVAGDADDAVASTRPPGTTAAQFDLMVDDVLANLALRPDHRVIELGCGTGVLAVPIAKNVREFVGVDFAHEALEVLRRRLDEEHLSGSTSLIEADLIHPSDQGLGDVGTFDRVLVYATFHYVTSASEAQDLLGLAVGLLRPGGRAVIGNLPLDDVAACTAAIRTGGPAARLIPSARWLITGDASGIHPLRWRLAALVRQARAAMGRRRSVAEGPVVAGFASAPLSTTAFERWTAELDVPTTHTWVAPSVGTPMYLTRADLVITRSPG